jgi:hypothetical protein
MDEFFFSLQIGMKTTSYYQRLVVIMALILRLQVCSTLQLYFRNQSKLQAYQQEYAQQKQAPGYQKVSKEKWQLLEGQHVKK